MSCDRFEQVLDRLLAGSLSVAERVEAEIHLEGCRRCRQLEQIARGAAETGLPNGSPDLARSILEHTSGRACDRLRDLACALADGELQDEERQLAGLHLEHCTPCSELFQALVELKQELPGMAELKPPAGFSAAVLQVTTSARREAPSWWFGFKERLAVWTRQPRFTLEAAYLGTLLLVAVLGNPVKVLDRTSPYVLSALQVDVRGTWEAGVRSVPPQWIEWGTGAAVQLQDVSERLAQAGAARGALVIRLLQGDPATWETVYSPAAGALQSSLSSLSAFTRESGKALLGSGPNETAAPATKK